MVVVGVGGGCKVIFKSNPMVGLRLGWGFDNNNGYRGGATCEDYYCAAERHQPANSNMSLGLLCGNITFFSHPGLGHHSNDIVNF